MIFYIFLWHSGLLPLGRKLEMALKGQIITKENTKMSELFKKEVFNSGTYFLRLVEQQNNSCGETTNEDYITESNARKMVDTFELNSKTEMTGEVIKQTSELKKETNNTYKVDDSDTWEGSIFETSKLDKVIKNLDPLYNCKYDSFDDLTISLLLGTIFGFNLLFCRNTGKWYYYSDYGRYMSEGRTPVIVYKSIKHVIDRLIYYLLTNLKEDKKENEAHNEKIKRIVKKISGASFRKRLEEDLRERHIVTAEEFDADNSILNCKNGILKIGFKDSKEITLEFKDHDPSYKCTMVCNVDYNPDAKCPTFDKALLKIMDGDYNNIKYLQMVLGSCLLGRNRYEKMYILYGPTTRNGKSTITETIHYVLGDYGCNIEPDTIASKKKDSRSASGDVARLKGKRYVQVSEPNKKMVFDIALLKRMTGNDTITARKIYEEEVEFNSMFTIFMNTNYLPVVMDDTFFASDRVRVIPFNHHFKADEQDSMLKEVLLTEAEGIFNWLLEGLKMFQKDPNFLPESVHKATLNYQEESDKIMQFLNEYYDESPKAVMSGKKVYNFYKTWCLDNGYKVDGKTGFFRELKKKGYMLETGTVNKKTERNVLVGFSLKDDIFEQENVETEKEVTNPNKEKDDPPDFDNGNSDFLQFDYNDCDLPF